MNLWWLCIDADTVGEQVQGMHTCPAKGWGRHDIAHQQHQDNAQHDHSSTQGKSLCSIVRLGRQNALQEMTKPS